MIWKWIEENVTMSDCLIVAVLVMGVIGLIAGFGELATAALGSATTYVVKDKARRTLEEEAELDRLRKELEAERRKNDAHLEKEVATARAGAMDSPLSDLVDSANQRVGCTD